MARWGSVDFQRLQRLQEKINRLEAAGIEQFNEKAVKLLAQRFLAKVIKRTPVGLYTDGRVGGTLRRGWTAKTPQEAYGGTQSNGAKSYANSLSVTKRGNNYEVVIENVVEYAAYVEFGHRTRNGGFVPGRFFMTISANEVQDEAERLLQRELDKLIGDAFR